MPTLPGVPHQRAVRALQKAGFVVIRQGKHTILSNGVRTVQVPRHDPVNAYTMVRIVHDAGLTIDEFKQLM